jgi:hypothetical protein
VFATCTKPARPARAAQARNDLAETVQHTLFVVLYQMSSTQVMLLFVIKLAARLRFVVTFCTAMW